VRRLAGGRIDLGEESESFTENEESKRNRK
jgi:hypothetical protein